MESKFTIITSFITLAFVIGVTMFVFDHLMPHASILDHIWHAAVSVAPAFTVYGIVTIRAYNRRKLTEEALRESQEQFRTSVENMLDCFGIYSTIRDESGRIVDFQVEYINEAACANNRMTREEQVGKRLCELLPAHRETGLFDEYCQVIETGKPLTRETFLYEDVYKEQRLIRAFDIRAVKLRDGFAVAWRDVTERKRAGEQLQHSQVLASLGEMAAGISHEVNNPLGSVLIYSELLLKSDVPRQTRKDLRIIHNEAKRAVRIMTDLLAYSRKLTHHMHRLNLHSILKKALDMRRYEERVQNISVSTNLLSGPLYVKGDSSQLTQVFLNLMLNAEEALQEQKGGNIKVTTEADGEWAKVSIADDGAGIPEDKLSQVFHPFFTTKKVGEGTGLGLSTCHGIVTAHGGLIRAENNDKGGAIFTVELPLAGKGRQRILPLETEETSSQSHNESR